MIPRIKKNNDNEKDRKKITIFFKKHYDDHVTVVFDGLSQALKLLNAKAFDETPTKRNLQLLLILRNNFYAVLSIESALFLNLLAFSKN